jgi:hypothetical protein
MSISSCSRVVALLATMLLLLALPLAESVAQTSGTPVTHTPSTSPATGTAAGGTTRDTSPSAYLAWLNSHREFEIAFGLVVFLIVAATGVVLYFAAGQSNTPTIANLNVSFFFWLELGYIVLLLATAVFYNLTWMQVPPLMFGGVLPAAVPWFGALGAVVISLEGIFAYGQKLWDSKYNYWHIGRPLFGAVLGIVAYFSFLLIVSSSGTLPPFLSDPDAKVLPKDFIVYYIVAFLVGYREETFRELMRRVTDMILKPTTPAATAPVVTFKSAGAALSALDFGTVAPNASKAMTVTVENTGNGALTAPSVALDSSVRGTEFKITLDQLSNARELKPGESRNVEVTFQSAAAGQFSNALVVTGTNLSSAARLKLTATV